MKSQFLLLCIFSLIFTAQARPVRDIYLELDILEAEVVAAIKVIHVDTTAKGVQFGQFRVDEQNVSCKVLKSIKGDYATGEELNFLHHIPATPEEGMRPNGFSAFQFQPSRNYLLILDKNADSKLQLMAPEASSVPEFSDELLSLPVDALDKTPLEQVEVLLILSFFREKEPPEYSLRSLNLLRQTKTFQGFLRAASSAYQTEETLRKAESSAREEALARIPVECRDGLDVQARVARGQPVRQILATVESENVDLIVMGKTHLKKRTERALMGHVTGKALRNAPCSVLTVPI